MISLSKQLKNDIKALFEENEEYKDIIVKEQYEIYPKISYPMITIREINNEDVNQYFDDYGENVSYLAYQIEISAEQSETRTALENVQNLGEILDDYLKGERYWCLRRVGDFAKTPMRSDNNVIIGYLRYECNVDIKTNTIYRRY